MLSALERDTKPSSNIRISKPLSLFCRFVINLIVKSYHTLILLSLGLTFDLAYLDNLNCV